MYECYFLHPRAQSRQGQGQTPSSDTPESSSVTNFIYKSIINSPKLFRRTMTPSTDESPMSVRSNSPHYRKKLRDDNTPVARCSAVDNVTMSAPNTPGSKRALLPRSPCGVKIFNPPTCSPIGSPIVTEAPMSRQRSPSPLSAKTSGESSQTQETQLLSQRSTKYLSTSRSSSPTPSLGPLSGRNSMKAHSRATTPTSPMFVKLFNARHSASAQRPLMLTLML